MNAQKKAWGWVPPLYFIEGLPNAVIAGLAVIFYSNMGLADKHSVAVASLLGLPWIIKPLWSPLVDSVSSKRRWVIGTLSVLCLSFALLALVPFVSFWFALSVFAFFMLGFASATYDISADGFYMLALSEKNQAFFVGIRNTFYRCALIFAQGGLLVLVGKIAKSASVQAGWSSAFGICTAMCFAALCAFIFLLPKASLDSDREPKNMTAFFAEFAECFVGFFKRPFIIPILCYVLFYRFAEAQLSKNLPLFLMAAKEKGGLALSLEQSGFVYGTVGLVCLLAGGIVGGMLISKYGLVRCIFPMALAINLPNILYVLLAYVQPSNIGFIGACVGMEQMGYGAGFAAYMMFLIHTSKGVHKTSHYAIATGFMALGLHATSFVSGYIKDFFGFADFFCWVMLSTIVSFAVTYAARRALTKGL